MDLVGGDIAAQPSTSDVDKGGDGMNQDLLVVPSHNFLSWKKLAFLCVICKHTAGGFWLAVLSENACCRQLKGLNTVIESFVRRDVTYLLSRS